MCPVRSICAQFHLHYIRELLLCRGRGRLTFKLTRLFLRRAVILNISDLTLNSVLDA